MADGVLGFLGDIAFPTAMQRMREREAGQQMQQLLGQQGQQYQPGAGQGMLENIPGTGLLGGQLTPQQFGAEMMGIPGREQLGAQIMQQYAPKPQAPASPTSQMQNLQAMGLQPGTPEYTQAMERLIMPQQAAQQQKPLGKESATWTNMEGQAAPPTMTLSQAYQAGFTPKTPEQIKTAQATQQFAPMLGKSIQYGFGGEQKVNGETVITPSLFPKKAGMLSRLESAWESGQAALGYEPQLASYTSTTDAMVSNLARMAGQVGVLTDLDVERVKSLIPQPYVTTEKEARQKYKDMADLLMAKGVSKEMMLQAGLPEWAMGGKTKKAVHVTPSLPPPLPVPVGIPQGGMTTGINTGPKNQSPPWLRYQR